MGKLGLTLEMAQDPTVWKQRMASRAAPAQPEGARSRMMTIKIRFKELQEKSLEI